MSGVHRTGLTELHSGVGPVGEAPKAIIVFIHGLGGHPKNTWSAKSAPQTGQQDQRRASDSSSSSVRANAGSMSGGERKSSVSVFTKFMPKRTKTMGLGERNMSVSTEGGISPHEVNVDPFTTVAPTTEPDPLSIPALSPPAVPTSNPLSRTTSIATTTAGFPPGLPDNVKKIFWPRDLLPHDFPTARIYTFGYDADLVNFGGTGKSEVKVLQHAHELCVTLNKELQENIPVILCAHSLGGVLAKRALYESSTTTNPLQQRLCNQTKAILFFGTPHRGSSTASWGKIGTNIAAMANLDSRQHLVKQLRLDSELLDIFHSDFMRLISEGKFWVHTFQEGLAMNNFIGKVVEDYSSKLDEYSPMQTTEVINGNHRTMIRFSSAQDPGYRKVVSALKQYISKLDEKHDQERRSIASVYSANEVPTYFSVPYQRNIDFTGRKECIDEINKIFSGPKHTPFVALHGLGGIGKTQVAIELAYQWKQFYPLYSVFWVHATSVERFDEGLQGILDKLQIPHSADTNIRNVIEEWLSDESNGQWLLIIDNVDDRTVLDQNNGKGSFKMLSCIPSVAHGHVLFTSRYKNRALELAQDTVRIDQMSPPEAFELLKKSLRERYSDEEKVHAEKLLDELSCIPLAITQAAAYIRVNEDTIENYLALYQESEENRYELLEQGIEALGITSDKDTPKMVLKTFGLSFDRLKTDGPAGPLATELLSLMSFLDRQHIPRSLLQTLSKASSLKLNNALGRLKAYALITENEGSKEYSMHRLVQLSMRQMLESEGKAQKFRDQVLTALSTEFPNGSYATWDKCRSLMVHADAILEHSAESDDHASRVKLLANCANFQNGRGQYAAAVKKYKAVIEIREESLGVDHVDTLRAQDQLAGTLRNQAEKREALEVAKKTLARKEELFGKNSAEALTTSHIVGVLMGDEGHHQESSAIHTANLKSRTELLGAEHLDTLRSAAYLSIELWQLGKFAEAEDLARQTLASRTKALGEDHPETLEIAEILGFTLEIQGKYVEAKELKEGMLTIRKEKYGEDHPDTADSHHDMGWIHHQMGNYEDAEPHYAASLKAKELLLGPTHWKTLTTMCNYPVFYCDKGAYDDAEKRSKKLIAVFKQIQGPNHPQTLDATGGLAVILRHLGKLDEAAKAARTSIDGRNVVLGPDHPWTLPPVSHWGYILTLQGDHAQGEKVIREALAKLEEHMGPVSSNVLTSLVFLSKNLLLQAQAKSAPPGDPLLIESEQLARRALESRKKLLGELPPGSGIQHPYTYKTMHHLARVLFAKGMVEEAAKLSREALGGMVRTLGAEHPDVWRADEELRDMETKLEGEDGDGEGEVVIGI